MGDLKFAARDQNLNTLYRKQLERFASSTCEIKISSFGLTLALCDLSHFRTPSHQFAEFLELWQVLAWMPISPYFA